jgi:hypothetical protein
MLEQRLRLLGVRAGSLHKSDALSAAAPASANAGTRDQLLLPMYEGLAPATPGI